jgi:ribosomal protein L16 Arg81 hydroxylase
MSTATMAKPKAGKRVLPDPLPRKTVLTIKGTDAWKEWLDRLSRHLRTPTSTLVDHALIRYAKEQGFDEPAPER